MVAVKHRAWALRAREVGSVEVTTTDSLARGEPRVAALCERLGPAEGAERRERVSSRAALLPALKPDERAALLLLGLGYSYSEIGELRGWTRTKINRCLAEGRAALRRLAAESEVSRGF